MPRRVKLAVVMLLLLLAATPSLLAWASPVAVHDWTLSTPVGTVGVKTVGYDLGFGSALQNVHTQVYLGPIGKTTPTVATSGAVAFALLIYVVLHFRRDKSDARDVT